MTLRQRAPVEDHAARLQDRAVGHLHAHQTAGLGRGDELIGALQVHDVHFVVAHLGFHLGGQFGAVGFQNRNVVFDAHGVVDLATKALSGHAHANALARRVYGCGRTRGTTTDDQHIKRVFRVELVGFAAGRAGVELGQNFFQAHAARAEHLAVGEDHGHGHDLALLDFGLEQAAVNDGGVDLGVEDGHQGRGLHHVRAVVARQGHVDIEVEIGVQGLDLVQHIGLNLGWVTTSPEQGQDQGGELMAQRNGGKTHTALLAFAGNHKRGVAGVLTAGVKGDLVRQGRDLLEQRTHLQGFGAVVERSDQTDGRLEHAKVGLQLGLQGRVEHEKLLEFNNGGDQCRWCMGPAEPMRQRYCL